MFPDVVVLGIDLVAVVRGDRAVTARDAILRSALEAEERLYFFGDGGDDLHASRAVTYYADTFIVEVMVFGPLAGMVVSEGDTKVEKDLPCVIHFSFKAFDVGICREVGFR